MSWEHYYEQPYNGTVTSDYYILRDLLHKSRLGQFNLWQLKVAASVFKDVNTRRKRPSKKIAALCCLVENLKLSSE